MRTKNDNIRNNGDKTTCEYCEKMTSDEECPSTLGILRSIGNNSLFPKNSRRTAEDSIIELQDDDLDWVIQGI